MDTETCPDSSELVHLLLGKLREPRAGVIGQHLLNCSRCARRAGELDVNDELTTALGDQPHIVLNESEISAAIRRAEQLMSEPASDTTFATGGNDGTIATKSRFNKAFDFLAPAEGSDEIGRLDSYRILELLGAGGMGLVFRAEDIRLQRQVAIKVMHPDIAKRHDARRRFLREAQATAQTVHDHIVTVHQVSDDRDVPFFAMQFLRGQSLRERLRRGQLAVADAVKIGRQIAEGLHAAHECRLVHGDIKPANIWLEQEADCVKIVDFGLVKSWSSERPMVADTLVGTPAYMAPEQAMAKKVDSRADLFGLGGVLYEMVAGEPAFKGESVAQVLIAIANLDYVPLDQACPWVSPDYIDLVHQLLSKLPEERPSSAGEVADRLARMQGPANEPENQLKAFAKKLRSTRRWIALLCGVAVVASVVGLVTIETNHDLVTIEIESDHVDVDVSAEGWRSMPPWNELPDGTPGPLIAPVSPDQARSAQLAWARHLETEVERTLTVADDFLLALCLVPPGQFLMGTSGDDQLAILAEEKEFHLLLSQRIVWESPQHLTRITRPFWIGKNEISVRQFRSFVESTRYETSAEKLGGSVGWDDKQWRKRKDFLWNSDPRRPVTDEQSVASVSHVDARAFCRWLTDQDLGWEFRLPTEAEWEFACRAGSQDRFSFADHSTTLEIRGWYRKNSGHRIHSPGELEGNAFGICDMHGNVHELCLDWFASTYFDTLQVDPQGPDGGSSRAVRGGYWGDVPSLMRSASRSAIAPESSNRVTGFRVMAVKRE